MQLECRKVRCNRQIFIRVASGFLSRPHVGGVADFLFVTDLAIAADWRERSRVFSLILYVCMLQLRPTGSLRARLSELRRERARPPITE